MKLPIDRGIVSKNRCRSILYGLVAIGMTFLLPSQAFAQLTCQGAADINFNQSTFLIGEPISMTINVGAGSIAPDPGSILIDQFSFFMDCQPGGTIFTCVDQPGNDVEFLSVDGTTCENEGGDLINWSTSEGNQVIFIADNGPVFEPENTTCEVDFTFRVNSASADVINLASGFFSGDPGEDPPIPPDAICNNGLVGQASGTGAFVLDSCEVELYKSVCVDLDGDGLIDQCFGEGEKGGSGATIEGKAVEWNAEWENTGTLDLGECFVTDPTLGYEFGPFVLAPGEGAADLLDTGSCDARGSNTAMITCNLCGGEDREVSDEDTVEIQCPDCNVEIDKQVACEFPPEDDEWVDISGGDDGERGPPDTREPLGCVGWTGDDEVNFRYNVTNHGQLDVIECYVTDTHVGFGFPGRPVNLDVPGSFDTFDVEQIECTTVEGDSTGFLNCECIPFIDGVPLDEQLGLSEPIDSFGPECIASDSDSVNVDCLTAGVSVTKTCGEEDEDGNWNVVIEVSNTFEADLETCALVDTLDGVDVTAGLVCDGDPSNFDLPAGGVFNCTGQYPAGDEEVLNHVDVVCDIVNSKKQKQDSSEDLCIPGEEGCFTRTPGYWGTHPESTLWALDGGLISCGVLIDNADGDSSGAPGSAIEDMCSIGKDHKSAKTTNTQLNLERHCMAAMLNISATHLQEGGSCESEYPGISEGLAFCCGAGEEVGEESICNTDDAYAKMYLSDCIGFVAGFNELDDGNELDEMDLCPDNPYTGFEAPCSADSSACRAAKGNQFVNGPRDREEVCHGKGCP